MWAHYQGSISGYHSSQQYGILTLKVDGYILKSSTLTYPYQSGFTFELALDSCFEPTVITPPSVSSPYVYNIADPTDLVIAIDDWISDNSECDTQL